MPSPKTELPHQEVIGRALAAGQLARLLLANTNGPCQEFREPIPSRRLTQLELGVGVDLANGLDVVDVAAGSGHLAKRRAAAELKYLFGIPEIVQANAPARRLLMRCLYTGQYADTGERIVEPDQPAPTPPPKMPDIFFVPFGLLTYGLDYVDAGEALDCGGRLVKRRAAEAADWLRGIYPHDNSQPDRGRVDTIWAMHAAFETGVLSPNPDRMMPVDFLVSSMRTLLQKYNLVEPV